LRLPRISSPTLPPAVIRTLRSTLGQTRLPDESANCLEKTVHGNGFGDVRLASALSDALLVALHGEGCDGDNRNASQLIVILEPLGHLQPRDLGKLDVHDDEVRPMLSRQMQRLDAVPRL